MIRAALRLVRTGGDIARESSILVEFSWRAGGRGCSCCFHVAHLRASRRDPLWIRAESGVVEDLLDGGAGESDSGRSDPFIY